jgi:hypothetical protein
MRKLSLIFILGSAVWARMAANDGTADPALAWNQIIAEARDGLTLPQTLRDQCPTPPINLARAPSEETKADFLTADDTTPKMRARHNGVLPAPEGIDPGIMHDRLDKAPPTGAKQRNYGGGDFRVLPIAASETPAADPR